MPQKMENTYVLKKKDNLNGHKEIYMEYPFAHSVRKNGSRNNDSNKLFPVKELASLWLTDIQDILRPSSYARYQRYTGQYILPYIGEIAADLFDKEVLSSMLGILQAGNGREAPLSQYTVYVVESMVRAMFHYGAEKKLVPEIAFGKAGYMIKNKKDAMPLSDLEVCQLVNVAEQQEIDMQLQVMVPLYTGISLSELCGLKWKDIDLENGKIHIHRNLMRVQQGDFGQKVSAQKAFKEENMEGQHIKEKNKNTKDSRNKKKATILAEFELPESECREFVRPEKLNSFLQEIALIKKPDKEKYVAGLDKKTPKSGTELIQPDGRTLQNRLKALGGQAWIPELTFKRLRDTFAVMCLQAGGDLYSVAYVLGVGTGAVCDRYGQWLVKRDGFIRGIG